MNRKFNTSYLPFRLLPRSEQELLVIDSALNRIKIEFWDEHYKAWYATRPPQWVGDTRYRRKPELLEHPELLEQHVNVYWSRRYRFGFTKAYPTSDMAEEAAHNIGIDVLRVAVHMREVRND